MTNNQVILKLTPMQRQIYLWFLKEHCDLLVESGRRSGKTQAIITMLFSIIMKGERAFYATPYWFNTMEMYKTFVRQFAPYLKKMSQKGEVSTANGGYIRFTQFGTGDAILRGGKYHYGIVDEAAYGSNLISFIQGDAGPTLIDYAGRLMLSSTPKGLHSEFEQEKKKHRNLAMMGDKRFKYLHGTIYANPYIPRDEIENLKKIIRPEHFKQEFLAIPQNFDGLSFFNLSEFQVVDGYDYSEYDKLFLTMDTAYKAGIKNDGTGYIVWGIKGSWFNDPWGNTDYKIDRLDILDYEIVKVQSSNLENFIKPIINKFNLYQNFYGVCIEDKGSGQTLIQQLDTAYGGKIIPITSRYGTNKSKEDRATVAYRFIAEQRVAITQPCFNKQVEYNNLKDNWLLKELAEFKIGVNAQQDDLVDCLSYGVIMAFAEVVGGG